MNILISYFLDGNPINYITSANLVSWLSVLYLGAIMTVLGYSAWFYSLAKFSMPVAMPFLLLQPLTAIIGSFLIFGEFPGFQIVVGGLIIIFRPPSTLGLGAGSKIRCCRTGGSDEYKGKQEICYTTR